MKKLQTKPTIENKHMSNIPTSNIKFLTSNAAITLIALIVTIIVLLILAGVSINALIGENGLIGRAKLAKEKHKEAQENEELKLSDYKNTIDEYIKGNSRNESKSTIFNLPTTEGDGSESNPYIITNAIHLQILGLIDNTEGMYVKLGNDIDLSSVCSNLNGNWTTIIGRKNKPFKGIFDGNGKTISNMYVKNGNDGQCLFGYNEGIIKNLTVTGQISNTSFASGIVYENKGTVENCINNVYIDNNKNGMAAGIAFSNKGIIRKCINNGNILASKTVAISGFGGIVDENEGTIEKCINIGKVEGYNAASGISGHNSGIIKECVNKGIISGTSAIGGIAGHNNSGGQIYNSYNTGLVSGTQWIGGITGYNGYSSKSYIYNCYSINTTIIVGISANSSIVSNCYISGMTDKNLNNGIDDYNQTINTETPWKEDLTPNINGGYPILMWQ